MSNASSTFANLLLKHLFQNAALPGVGDAAGLQSSDAAGSFYIRLCTDAVVPDKDTIGAECAYTGYAAKGIASARTDVVFSDTGNVIKNASELLFGACTAGEENARYVELWMNNTGSTEAHRIAFKQLNADISITPGVQPKFAAEALTFTFL